jgi:hypothetical protein
LGRTESTRQVDSVPHPQAIGGFPQLGAGGRKKPALIELVNPVVLALGATTRPHEDPGQFRRNLGLALAKEATGVFDQIDNRHA